MKIDDLLSASETMVGVKAPDKARLIQEIAARAASSLKVDAAQIALELTKREELGSTGMGGGFAIPHARLKQVGQPFGMLWRLKKPIDFDAVDSEPVDLIFALLLPATAPGDHLNALACVARKLRQPDVVERLRRAEDGAELFREVTR